MIEQLLEQHYNLDKLLIKDKLIQGGGGSSYLYYINLLIGIILITIGMMCMFYDKFWEVTEAKILGIKNGLYETDLLIGYDVDNKFFTKLISISSKSKYNIGDKINIHYEKKDPNIIKLTMYNHKIIGLLLGLIGIYLIINKYLC